MLGIGTMRGMQDVEVGLYSKFKLTAEEEKTAGCTGWPYVSSCGAQVEDLGLEGHMKEGVAMIIICCYQLVEKLLYYSVDTYEEAELGEEVMQPLQEVITVLAHIIFLFCIYKVWGFKLIELFIYL